VFKIGESDGAGNCEDPEDVPGWWVFPSYPVRILQNNVLSLKFTQIIFKIKFLPKRKRTAPPLEPIHALVTQSLFTVRSAQNT
jgi:hypothetical protein